MERDSRKNGSYRCVTKRLNTGFDCSEDRIPESDILYAVIDTIQFYAQYAVSIDRPLQTRREQRQLDRKQAQRRLQTLQSRKDQLDERLFAVFFSLYELKLQTIPSAFSSVNFGINLAKEIKRISAHDLKELRLAVTNILLFNPDTINPFPEVPEEVSSLSYRLDYSELPNMDESTEKELLDSLFEWF